MHPEDGKLIRPASAATAPSSCTTAPTPTCRDIDEVFDVGLNRAVALLAEKRAGAARAAAAATAPLKDLGAHPETASRSTSWRAATAPM